MVLVFFITGFILLLSLIIVLSTIGINIEKVHISNTNSENKLQYDYIIKLGLYFLNKIKFLSIKIDKEKMKKLNIKNKLKNIDFKQVEQDLPSFKENKEILKKLQIRTEKFKLNLEIGIEDVIITSVIITIISSLIGIVLGRSINKYKEKNYMYKILPIYKNKNLINLNLNCIIKVKVVHIIYIIYVLVKKRRVNKNERTSNRRSYDYSYE